jgi:uncharacterized protein
MDRFADGMVARGPTLGPDRETWTGSLHILGLQGVEAVREFVAHEPYNRAGLFAHHTIRRFENLLGRTMWEFPGASADPRFLVIANDGADLATLPRLIIHGALRALDDARPAGVVFALQAPARRAVEALARGEAEIHDWEFGGRR